jgi:hypothetical protein
MGFDLFPPVDLPPTQWHSLQQAMAPPAQHDLAPDNARALDLLPAPTR